MTLQELQIENRDEQKYATRCPKCADTRSKSNAKSLMVYKDEDGIRFECLHDDCTYFNNRQFISNKGREVSDEDRGVKIKFTTPIPESAGSHPLTDKQCWTYKNTKGETLFYVARIDKEEGKYYLPLAYTEDGEWATKSPGIKALYGAELLSENKPYVIVVEGEKAADAGNRIFPQATVVTWQGGAKGIKNGDWDLLEGRKVVLWPDNDDAGRKAMQQIAGLISGQVSIVDVGSLPPKADLADDLDEYQIRLIWDSMAPIDKSPKVTGSLSAEQIKKRMSRVSKGETLGWGNMNRLKLPAAGQVVIEGRTGMGKSTMMINIFAQKIKQGRFPLIFYSFEMTAEDILVRLAMILDGRELDTDTNTNTEMYHSECLSGDNETFNKLLTLLDKEIIITDEYMLSDKLLEDLLSPRMSKSLVFIDYAQYVQHRANGQSRYLALKSFMEKLQNVAKKNNFVVFNGSQLTIGETPEKDSPRECWDINFAADLVIRVWNKKEAETRGAKWAELDELPGNFLLKIMKNRSATSGQVYCFDLENGGGLKEISSYVEGF